MEPGLKKTISIPPIIVGIEGAPLTKEDQAQRNVGKANVSLSSPALQHVSTCTQQNLDEYEEEHGQPKLIVGVCKVLTSFDLHGGNGKEEADKDEEESKELDSSVGGEPSEHGATKASN
jgi:hypothetical protein